MKKWFAFSISAICAFLGAYSSFISIGWFCAMVDSGLIVHAGREPFHRGLSLACSLLAIIVSIVLAVHTFRSSNLDHAARLTYEEYRERAKQKKLEKTRKKMQELEEKLQKESTE